MQLKTNNELFKRLTNINMEISDARLATLDSTWCADGICSPFTRIYMMLGGEAFISDSSGEIKMTAGKIYVIPANHDFSYRCEATAEKMYFHISLLMTGNFDALAAAKKIVVIKESESIIEEAFRMLEREDLTAALSIKSILYSITERCLLLCGCTEKAASYSPLVKKAFEYVENNLSSSLSVSGLSDALYVSPSKLQKSFKSETGISVGKYIDDCLMLRAERLLRCTEKTIAEISEQLGFCDRFYFSRLFSARYGLAPNRYRKKVCMI